MWSKFVKCYNKKSKYNLGYDDENNHYTNGIKHIIKTLL